MAPDDRERDAEEQPRVRITDRRRFANLGDDPAAPAEGTGAALGSHDVVETIEHEATEVAGDLQAAQGEARTNLDRLLRLQAEFDNYRKRVAKEQAELSEMSAMPVARRLLEVLDDFELALMSAEDQPDFDRFLKGVELVHAKLMDALKAEGLERMHAEGAPFDPELHEALLQTGEGEGDPIVADVLRPGYTLRGRVLRHAGVRVERED